MLMVLKSDKFIKGAVNTLEKYKPILIMEIKQDELENMKIILSKINYNIVQYYYPWDYLIMHKDNKK